MVRPSATTGMERIMVSERSGEAKIRQDNNLEHMLPKEYFDDMGSGLLYIDPRRRASWSLQQKRYQINTAPDIAVRSKTPESPLVLFHRPEAPDIHNKKNSSL